MKETRQQTLMDDEATLVVGGEETTLVAPRFDDEETLVARPVVPLEEGAHAPLRERPSIAAPRPAPSYRSRYAPRRTWTLALVLVSVLVGGVLGGAGLYLYQRQSQDPAVSPAAMTQPAAPADAAQAPPAEVRNTTPPESTAPQAAAPTGAASNAEEPAPPARDAEASAAAPAREPENVPAAERRTAPSDGTPKRGKKGERDAEIERRDTPQPGGNVARAEAPQARQVDTIFYRQRRAERQAERRAARRARRDDDVDRLRRIFEGTPE